MAEYGVITEQGDLGLGFNLLNEKDNKVVNEAANRERNEINKDRDISIINEKK